ncbi:MAG: RagB/SusD family nutrient uptake outer membrane protein [Prevotellaceae bacterium]|nr:RagB/SusD family nutrient uptake outer membrane protein [Prevotellaceae bacterium]
MKLKNIAFGLVALAGISISTTSCEDMLTVDTGDKMYTNANDTLYSYLGILKNVQNIAERQIILNEVRGDLCIPTEYVTDTLHAIAQFEDPADGTCSMLKISDYYAVINNCNLYIANADTNRVKSNIKFMLPEYAQVQAIRAWTYLQLVQLYGEVPFITEPITNLDVVKNFDYSGNLVNKDNLLDRILELGLTKYVDTKYPSYGQYNNGAIDIPSSACFIPVRLVLGDLYLLRGASQSDYRTAAQYYYDFLKGPSFSYTTTPQYCSYTKFRSSNGIDYMGNTNGVGTTYAWGAFANRTANPLTEAGTDVLSIIPSSANRLFGTMLTRVADIFGYTPSSTSSTESSTNDNGDEEVSTSGSISVTRNYQAQIVPSPLYEAVNKAQTYVYYDQGVANPQRETYDCGDARYAGSTEEFTYERDNYVLASKAARGTTFYYSVPIYRKSLVWLRLAEAINRAGFPEHAFAILKDGLNYANTPVLNGLTTTTIIPLYDENGNRLRDENNQFVNDTITTISTRYNTNGALHYVDSLEIADFFLDFTDARWAGNFGIHARGCGFGNWPTITQANGQAYTTTNITGYNDSIAFDYRPRLEAEGINFEIATKADIINAVENVICDELALELAFEGYRFSDLMRMAHHKNASGYNGTQWLAAKIANRGVRTSTDGMQPETSRDEDLYAKLLNPANWYLTKPLWKNR